MEINVPYVPLDTFYIIVINAFHNVLLNSSKPLILAILAILVILLFILIIRIYFNFFYINKDCGECNDPNNNNCTSCASTGKYLDAGICYASGACPIGKCILSFNYLMI